MTTLNYANQVSKIDAPLKANKCTYLLLCMVCHKKKKKIVFKKINCGNLFVTVSCTAQGKSSVESHHVC